MTTHPDFETVDRDGQQVWLHKTLPIWIVYYEPIEDSQSFRYAFWQPYRAVAPVKPGQRPWAVNNVKIGKEGGCRSLEAAFELATTHALNPEAAWPFPKKRSTA